MSREVRRVPPDWKHPTDDGVGDDQCWIPLYEGPYSEYSAGYDREAALWALGRHPDQREYPTEGETYPCWVGRKRLAEEYMPEFALGTATAFQTYDTTTEGVPISPVFETFDVMVDWWVENSDGKLPDGRRGWAKLLSSLLPEERAKRDVRAKAIAEALAGIHECDVKFVRPLNAETAGEWKPVDYSVLKSDPDWRRKYVEVPDYAECIRLCTGEPIRVEIRLEGGCRFKVMMTPNRPGYCRELHTAEEPGGIGVALERGRAWGSAFAEGWRLAKEAK